MRPGVVLLRSPRGVCSSTRPLRDPRRNSLAVNSSRRRREVSFVYPLRTTPSHPRCHAIRAARKSRVVVRVVSHRSAHLVYVVVIHLHVRARVLHVRSARYYIYVLFARALFV
jgi:hypothetical protein